MNITAEDLVEAIYGNEFSIEYCPLSPSLQDTLPALRVMLVWHSKAFSRRIHADIFVPVAKECSMLNMLDALALKLVCEEKTRRKEANKEVVVLRFCLSHLVFSNFFSFVKILLERFSVRSNELRFEVVNDMGGEGYSASIKDIEKIKSIGVDVRLCN